MLETADLRHGAKTIHSIGPDRAAGLLTAAADVIDKLRRDLDQACANINAANLATAIRLDAAARVPPSPAATTIFPVE